LPGVEAESLRIMGLFAYPARPNLHSTSHKCTAYSRTPLLMELIPGGRRAYQNRRQILRGCKNKTRMGTFLVIAKPIAIFCHDTEFIQVNYSASGIGISTEASYALLMKVALFYTHHSGRRRSKMWIGSCSSPR
jgi:hypothetical protein